MDTITALVSLSSNNWWEPGNLFQLWDALLSCLHSSVSAIFWRKKTNYLGGIFLFIGIGLYVKSLNLFDKPFRYDNSCTIGQLCTVSIEIDEELSENVYFYYEIRNFYQNHRRYFKSKSSEQLRGNELDFSAIEDDCDPVTRNKHLWKPQSIGNQALDPEGVAFPCGMMARSLFNGKSISRPRNFNLRC